MIFIQFYLPHQHKDLIFPENQRALLSIIKEIPKANATFEQALAFLNEFEFSVNNYNSYRTELNMFLNWSWQIKKTDPTLLKRDDINEYIKFTCKPPEYLITNWSKPALIENEDQHLILNPDWRPFTNRQQNVGLAYNRKETTIKKTLSSLSSLYQFLNDCDACDHNPAAIVLRRFNVKKIENFALSDDLKDKALSQLQVSWILSLLEQRIVDGENLEKWHRQRFLFHFLVLTYPRRSEIAPRLNWVPSMSDFRSHSTTKGRIWSFYIPSSKNGKSRQVICSKGLMRSLAIYRRFIGLSSEPNVSETTIPLFSRIRPGTIGRQKGILNANLSASQLAELISELFNETANEMIASSDSLINEAEDLRTRTIHSLRHTGISNDLASGRDAKDVMRCSGHSSMQALSVYISNRVEFRITNISKKDQLTQSHLKL